MNYYTDKEVNKFILSHIPSTIEDGRHEMNYWRQVFYKDDGIYFAIANKHDNKLIGSIGISSFNRYHQRIELSYDLNRKYWKRGIMTRAVAEVIKYGFNNYAINRIEAYVAFGNISSQKLLQKSGFTCEGILRSHRFHNGVFFDVYSYSLLRNEVKDGF
jgi:ribosomal-protein-alanine N-acetyltransferase